VFRWLVQKPDCAQPSRYLAKLSSVSCRDIEGASHTFVGVPHLMLILVAAGLAIDAYGPIADNAGGIAEMAGMGEEIRERTDALDAAGNTTAAIGKGFAIGSAALVSLALFGAYITRAQITVAETSILDPEVCTSQDLESSICFT